MQTIAAILSQAVQMLNTDTAHLDAEVLLAHVLKKSRAYLHTWPEKTIDEAQERLFFELITRRGEGEPIAYLIGHKEFWSLDLMVTSDVLIPRPETELLIEIVLQKISVSHAVIADLGTGSGAIALAIASEKPDWIIHATDKSSAALSVAKENAKRLNITNVIFHEGKWCAALPKIHFDAIVSNPPYIAEEDPVISQGDLRFEPPGALIAAEQGLQDLSAIIEQAKAYLKPNGLLLLEHGADQAKNVASKFLSAGYTQVDTYQDLAGLDRVTGGV